MKIQTIHVDENGKVDLRAFDEMLDITKVEYYEVVGQVNGSIMIYFYDKDQNPIKPFVR